MKRILLMLVAVSIGICTFGRKVTISSVDIARGKLGKTSGWTELIVNGNLDVALKINEQDFPKLKRLVYNGDVNVVEAGTFDGCPKLETVEFRGLVGYVATESFVNCPELRMVTFSGPVFSTGAWACMNNCPKVEKVAFNGLTSRVVFGDNKNCPQFKGYEVNGVLLVGFHIPTTSEEEMLAKKEALMPDVEKMSEFVKNSLASKNGKLIFEEVKCHNGRLSYIFKLYGRKELAADWKECGEFADPDLLLSKLDLLKKTSYAHDGKKFAFSYAPPSDSLLVETRNRFNLDSIAGDGDELSRIKNLLHFVHENIRHNGNAPYLNDIPYNFRALYDAQQTKDPGFNCRMMAIMLAEVLLAEGIPARYLMCNPKFNDGDSHVITIAWSRDLGKWIWVDPTFDAWVTDENGVMLGPAEVRERLISDRPLVLNDYANWNHQTKETVEHYLKEYMAKNLYVMGCNIVNRAEPEGPVMSVAAPSPANTFVYLVPVGDHYGGNPMTTDADVFFAAPEGL